MTDLTDYLKSELDKKLAACSDDNERYSFLIRQHNIWREKRVRFFRAVHSSGDLPVEFSFGPHGTISATDFIIVLGMIDAEQTKLERKPA